MRDQISNLEWAVMGIIGHAWRYHGLDRGDWTAVQHKLDGAIDTLVYGTDEPMPGLLEALMCLWRVSVWAE